MKKGTKIGLILGGVLLVVGFVSIAAVIAFTMFGMSAGTRRAREDFKKRTGQADGTITNVSLTTSSKLYTYKFAVNGVSYNGTYYGVRTKVETNYDKDVGRSGMVCYDPSNPNSSEFYFSAFYESGERKGERMTCGGSKN